MVKLSFIVSCFEDPLNLTCCLASLRLQTVLDQYFTLEIRVADNSVKRSKEVQEVCKMFEANYHKCGGESCYNPSAKIAKSLETDWLCFASSDGYYVSGFASTMLEVAVRLNSDLVYCNCLYDPRLHGRGIYSVLDTFPEMRWIDKTCFIIKKSQFKGFPPHKQDWRDGALVESFVKRGLKLDKAKGILVVHN